MVPAVSYTIPSDFKSWDIAAQREFYQKANEAQNVDLVRELNNLGLKPETCAVFSPSIISTFMDIATKYDIIREYFQKLRVNKRLFTESEFKDLSSRKWICKTKLSRLLGCDHLMLKIDELGLSRMKVPLKIAVIPDADTLKIEGYDYTNNFYDFNSTDIKIYAEEIRKVNRKLTRQEIDELIQLIAAANFVDIWPENFVIAEDGLYFIDTEFKSFEKVTLWDKLKRFEGSIDDEDKAYFQAKIKEKITQPRVIREINDYSVLSNVHMLYESKMDMGILNPNEKAKANEVKQKVLSLQYVGLKKAGYDWLNPNVFSFNVKDILCK